MELWNEVLLTKSLSAVGNTRNGGGNVADDTRRLSELTNKQRLELAEIAVENTKRSDEGLTVIKKDDEWRR